MLAHDHDSMSRRASCTACMGGPDVWWHARRRDEIAAVHDAPLLDLVFHAAAVHRQHNDPSMVRWTPNVFWIPAIHIEVVGDGRSHSLDIMIQQVQRCTLLSIKTGGCPETCTYCSQSSSWSDTTGMKAEKLMDLDEVYQVTRLGIYNRRPVALRYHSRRPPGRMTGHS